MKIIKNGITYHVSPTVKIDHLKGTWYLWECEIEDPNGNIFSGSIQGDGLGLWAEDSLEFEI